MLEFTSALGLDRVTTDITLTATIIRIVIIITGPTTGTADTVIIIATIVTTITTDIEVTQDLENRLGWLESNFEPAAFLGTNLSLQKSRLYLFGLADSAGLVAGLLTG